MLADKTKDAFLSRILCILSITVTLAALLLFTVLFRYDQGTKPEDRLYPIEIAGEYSEEGGPWQTLTRLTFFENQDLRNIRVRGHFSRALPKGASLFMNIDHMWVTMRVNGTEVYSIAPEEGDKNPTRATGKQWVTVTSPGITTADTVELNFGNLYWNAYMIQFDELLWQMHTGDGRMMLFEALRLDGWTIGIGTVFLFLTLFLLVVAIGCAVMRIRGAIRFLWLGLTTLFAALWFYTLSPAPTLILPLPVFLNVLYAFSMQAMAVFLVLFVREHISGWRRRSMTGCVGFLLFLMLIALINQILSIQDLYSAINYFSVFDLLVVFWMMFCMGYEACKLKHREAAELMKAMLPLIFAAVLELINGYVQFCKAAVLLGFGLLAFAMLEEFYTLRRIKRSMDSEKRALILENELNQSRISIMLSQIQPHFLYNSLLGIKQLCESEPGRATDALEHFSYFLRGNLDSLTNTELIPFEKEMSHLRDYLYLEQMRFSHRLNIVYELGCLDFMLPPLTVQAMAENAVRYGIVKRKKGGTLTIRSERLRDSVVVTVQDDGVGFDLEEEKQDGRSHVGIENVRGRLKAQCSGVLLIESQKGTGTTVKIILPQKEETQCGSLQ